MAQMRTLKEILQDADAYQEILPAIQSALNEICSARLCTVNSMSSRAEMLRCMGNAISTLTKILDKG